MPLTNTPETLNILTPDFRMPEHCGGDRWSILHGASLQILRQFEPSSFDAIITDPPYASGGSSQTTKNRSTSEKYSSMSKDRALHCQARCARLPVHRLAAAARHDAGFAVGGLDLARCSRVG